MARETRMDGEKLKRGKRRSPRSNEKNKESTSKILFSLFKV